MTPRPGDPMLTRAIEHTADLMDLLLTLVLLVLCGQ